MTNSCARVRRARPLLGTLVEMSLAGADEASLHDAATAAFEEIALIHDLMTLHAEGGDAHRINNANIGDTIHVHEYTWRVLQLALELSRASGGVFDVTVGGAMMARGAVPALVKEMPTAGATYRDIQLLPGNGVRVLRQLAVDFGGIAKGYAVDRAVGVLQAQGVSGGCINAGGDIRVFGGESVTVHVRDPLVPAAMCAKLELCDMALATSARYAQDSELDMSGLVLDPHAGAPVVTGRSASVRARACVLADALAKCVLLTGKDSAQLLRHYQAQAFVLDGDGMFVIGGDEHDIRALDDGVCASPGKNKTARKAQGADVKEPGVREAIGQ